MGTLPKTDFPNFCVPIELNKDGLMSAPPKEGEEIRAPGTSTFF